MIPKNCIFCGVAFQVHPCRKDKAKYCSKKCSYQHRKNYTPPSAMVIDGKLIKRPRKYILSYCANCKKEIYLFPSSKEDSKFHYCSMSCRNRDYKVRCIKNYTKEDINKLIWSKIDKTGDCWEWVGTINHSGYGVFSKNSNKILVHRYIMEQEHGKLDSSIFVCHKCDNRSCVRPDHLFLGSASDNSLDMVRKGRNPKGEQVGTTSLSNKAAYYIKYLSSNRNIYELCIKFNIKPFIISRIRSGSTWSHLSEDSYNVNDIHNFIDAAYPTRTINI